MVTLYILFYTFPSTLGMCGPALGANMKTFITISKCQAGFIYHKSTKWHIAGITFSSLDWAKKKPSSLSNLGKYLILLTRPSD
ncbi:hypothetical protein D770_05175 [Flammeovirgaceae bacterium 311]|nr:hypothetical protein D770_05175 [Flammeovirgaceae bacterium 311]